MAKEEVKPGSLTIVDVFSKVSPAIGVRFSYMGCDVVETLERAVNEHT